MLYEKMTKDKKQISGPTEEERVGFSEAEKRL